METILNVLTGEDHCWVQPSLSMLPHHLLMDTLVVVCMPRWEVSLIVDVHLKIKLSVMLNFHSCDTGV